MIDALDVIGSIIFGVAIGCAILFGGLAIFQPRKYGSQPVTPRPPRRDRRNG